LVAVAILNTVCAAVVCASTILFEPKEIALVLVLLELKIPVVRSKPPSANVPAVNVVVLVATREGLSPNVNVPPVRLKPIPPNCLLNCVVQVCVRMNIGVKPVYVPPVASVNVLTNTVAVAGVDVVPVKSSVLNQLLVVKVGTAAPLVNDKFGAVVVEPPAVEPKVNVLVTDKPAVKPPVPVQVKLVAVSITSTVVAAVVCAKTMLLLPNAIDLVLVLLELNVPVVRVNPLSASVPLVNVVVPVAAKENVPLSVVVPEVLLIVSAPNVALVLLLIVPVPSMVVVRVLYVPPLDKVRSPTMFKVVVPGLKVVVPKFKFLNQLAVVSVATEAPVVNVKLGAFVAEPPVVPNTIVFVTAALVVNPPVPV